MTDTLVAVRDASESVPVIPPVTNLPAVRAEVPAPAVVVPAPDNRTYDGGDDHLGWAMTEMETAWPEETAALKQRWGADLQRNFAFSTAFAAAHPDVAAILNRTGFADHPAIVEIACLFGRKYAADAVDPTTIALSQESPVSGPLTDPRAIDAAEREIAALATRKFAAMGRGDYDEAGRLDREQRDLIIRRHGNATVTV